MKKVLLLTSSPRGEASLSTQIATELAKKIENSQLVTRELWRDSLPHITPELIGAVYTPAEARTAEQVKSLALSDELVAELKAADVIVIGAGMINFGIPSTLKTWIDHIVRAGVTFSYGEAGPEGLVQGKKLILVLASGGVYSVGPMASFNHVEPYLRSSLGFLGLTDVETVLIEGTAMGPEATEQAVVNAKAKAETLAALHSS